MQLDNRTTNAIMNAIVDFWEENHYSPSIREIMASTGINSTSLIRFHIQKLSDAGMVEYKPRTARSIRPSNMTIKI